MSATDARWFTSSTSEACMISSQRPGLHVGEVDVVHLIAATVRAWLDGAGRRVASSARKRRRSQAAPRQP